MKSLDGLAYPLKLRQKVVDACLKGNTLSAVAKKFKLNYKTVQGYLRQYKQTGNLLPKYGDCGKKIGKEEYELIKKIIKDNPTMTFKEIAKIYNKKSKVKVSGMTINRACLKAGLKKKRKIKGKIDEVGEKIIKKLKMANPIISMGKLADLYYGKTGVRISRGIMNKYCLRLGLREKLKPKIDASGLKIIKKAIQSNPTITIKELIKLYYKKKGVCVCRNTIINQYAKLGLKKLDLRRKEFRKSRKKK